MKIDKIISVLFVASLAYLVVFVSLMMALGDGSFFHSQFEKFGVYENYGERQLVLEHNERILEFINGGELKLDPAFFGADEISHLYDVRKTFFILKIGGLICFLFVVASVVYLMKKKENPAPLVKSASIIILLFIVFLGASAYFSFDHSFEIFHKIFFPQGNWRFDSKSYLIRLYPQHFFEAIFYRIILVSIILSIGLLVLSRVHRTSRL